MKEKVSNEATARRRAVEKYDNLSVTHATLQRTEVESIARANDISRKYGEVTEKLREVTISELKARHDADEFQRKAFAANKQNEQLNTQLKKLLGKYQENMLSQTDQRLGTPVRIPTTPRIERAVERPHVSDDGMIGLHQMLMEGKHEAASARSPCIRKGALTFDRKTRHMQQVSNSAASRNRSSKKPEPVNRTQAAWNFLVGDDTPASDTVCHAASAGATQASDSVQAVANESRSQPVHIVPSNINRRGISATVSETSEPIRSGRSPIISQQQQTQRIRRPLKTALNENVGAHRNGSRPADKQ